MPGGVLLGTRGVLVAIFPICLYRERKVSSPRRKTGQTMATNATTVTIPLISHGPR